MSGQRVLAAEPLKSPEALTFRRLLVPYDGSPPANAALDVAIAFARAGSEIYIVNVVDEMSVVGQSSYGGMSLDTAPALDALDAQARALLHSAQERAKQSSIDAVTDLAYGSRVWAINETVEACECDLVVIGTHARTEIARMFLGSTTRGVLQCAEVPVLVVNGAPATTAFAPSTVLIAKDDSLAASAALRIAERLTKELHATLIAFTAPGTVAIGASIVHAAEERGADLVVTGTHGRKLLDRVVLGSVAEYVVRHSTVPVLVVPAHRR